MFKELMESAKREAEDAAHKMGDLCHKSEETLTEKRKAVTDRAHQVLVRTVDDFHKCLPHFEQAGFSLVRFDVEIGLTPKLLPRFMINHVASPAEQKEILAKVRRNRLAATIMKALFKAAHLHDVMRVGQLQFMGLEVGVSAVPTVRMIFGQPPQLLPDPGNIAASA